MRMYIPLAEPVYGKSDCLVVEVAYRKTNSGGVYRIEITPGGVSPNSFYVEYTREYYASYGTLVDDLVTVSRRSKKQEEIACNIAKRNASRYVNVYIDRVCERGGKKPIPVGGLMTKDEVLAMRAKEAVNIG